VGFPIAKQFSAKGKPEVCSKLNTGILPSPSQGEPNGLPHRNRPRNASKLPDTASVQNGTDERSLPVYVEHERVGL
jgi:hypothetical protein